MKKVKSLRTIIVLLLCAVFVAFGLLLSQPTLTSQAIEGSAIENTIKVEPIARENQSLSQDVDGNTVVFQWRQLQGFKISFDPSALEEGQTPPLAADGQYTMSLNIYYYPGYASTIPDNVDEPNSDWAQCLNVMQPIIAEDYHNLRSFTFNVDNFVDGIMMLNNEQTAIKTQGWGVYQFEIDINGALSTSTFYAVEPEHLTNDIRFDIAYEDSFTTSGHNAFDFYVVGADTEFKYVNKNCFVWYVYGQDFSDNNYVLLAEDATGEFANYNALYTQENSIARTGTTFYFDDAGHAGSWNVYCVYQDSYDNVNISIKSSQEQSVMTGEILQPSTIIWVVVGISIAVLAIVVVVIVVGVKKEKVW